MLFSLLLVVGVIGIGVAMYGGAKIDAVENIIRSATPSQRTFHDSEFDISFRYPREWEHQYVSPNITLFSGEGASPTMTLVLAKRKDTETLQQFRERNLQEIQESAAGENEQIDIEPVQQVRLGELTADRFLYHAAHNSVPIDGVQVWAVNGKKEYIMTFAARHDAFQTAVQAFDSVLKSVSIKQ
ncbi:MAG: PsbP-related protein [Candidatus Uhrbacteria bacterium]|nr:PsbP-related protein [Candidatus Uhrbacteria bacterium]